MLKASCAGMVSIHIGQTVVPAAINATCVHSTSGPEAQRYRIRASMCCQDHSGKYRRGPWTQPRTLQAVKARVQTTPVALQVVKHQHFVLVTLLICNAAANEVRVPSVPPLSLLLGPDRKQLSRSS